MSSAKLHQVGRILARIDKVIQSRYPSSSKTKNDADDDDDELDGDLLLRAIQYMVFQYIYQVSSRVERNTDYSQAEVERRAHWLYLRQHFRRFMEKWNRLAAAIQARVRRDILSQVNGEENHPLLTLFAAVVELQEMHVRRPKQSPANVITKRGVGEGRAVCFNAVDNSECVFGRTLYGKSTKYACLIFTPLPSDLNPEIRDPNERALEVQRDAPDSIRTTLRILSKAKQLKNGEDESKKLRKILDLDSAPTRVANEFGMMLEVDRMQDNTEVDYDVREQFCAVTTNEWGKLFRLLHNIFHLENYIAVTVVQGVDADRDRFKGMPWEAVWRELVGDSHCDASIKHFKKTKENPHIVAAIYEIRNVVAGALQLKDKFAREK